MEPIHRCKGKNLDFSKAPMPPRFKDFDNIDVPDTFTTCSICVRVDVKFPITSYGEKLRFILTDKSGSKIEAFVEEKDLVQKFNNELHTGCKYAIHGVTIRPNMEDLAYRNIGQTHECLFDKKTYVESCRSLDFPLEGAEGNSVTFLETVIVDVEEPTCSGLAQELEKLTIDDLNRKFEEFIQSRRPC